MGDLQTQLAAEIARLSELFVRAGGAPQSFDALQPAELLLDLYGEDIRSRAFTTRDGLSEMMLRPDFTAPVVARHMAVGAEPARYTYAGPVWRKKSAGTSRAREFQQVGFELFERDDAAEADAEVFALISEAVADYGLSVATGDIGILIAALDAIEITPARRASLRRHLWRPTRFRALLKAFAHPSQITPKRVALFEALDNGTLSQLVGAEEELGLRKALDVTARVKMLAQDAQEAPMSPEQIALLDAIYAMSGTARDVLDRLETLAESLPRLNEAVSRLAKRLDALETRGIDTAALPFEVSYGRTTLEYYDGFVFGFFAEDLPTLPVVASGGRYDALTRELGQGKGIPAVGGVVRPETLLEIKRLRRR